MERLESARECLQCAILEERDAFCEVAFFFELVEDGVMPACLGDVSLLMWQKFQKQTLKNFSDKAFTSTSRPQFAKKATSKPQKKGGLYSLSLSVLAYQASITILELLSTKMFLHGLC